MASRPYSWPQRTTPITTCGLLAITKALTALRRSETVSGPRSSRKASAARWGLLSLLVGRAEAAMSVAHQHFNRIRLHRHPPGDQFTTRVGDDGIVLDRKSTRLNSNHNQ